MAVSAPVHALPEFLNGDTLHGIFLKPLVVFKHNPIATTMVKGEKVIKPANTCSQGSVCHRLSQRGLQNPHSSVDSVQDFREK